MSALDLSGAHLVGGSLFLDRKDGPTDTPRMGQRWGPTQIPNGPCYVQYMDPGVEDYDNPWVDLNLYDPVPGFTLGWEHLGRRIRIVMKGLDEQALPDGDDTYSNEIGPVLHAVDPVGTTVATDAEFNAARLSGAFTIILAAGTDWNIATFSRTLSNVRITTPQDNPARVIDSMLTLPANVLWTNVVFEGIVFRRTSFGDVLVTHGGCNGLTFRGCKQIGNDVPPSVYQFVQAVRTQGPYWGRGRGMTTMGTFDLHRSNDIVIEGHSCRNVNRAFVLPNNRTVRHLRIYGWYGDGVQINANHSSLSDRGSMTDCIFSDCYSIYNEADTNAPHADVIQVTAGEDAIEQTIDGFVNCIGDTRAYGFSGTLTNLIVENSAPFRNSRFRRWLATGMGPITIYAPGSDYSFDYMTMCAYGTGAGALRFGGLTNSIGDEARISRSIIRGDVMRVGPTASSYQVLDDSATNIGAAIPDTLYGPTSIRPKTISDLALLARPRLPTTRGALLPSGHMRPFEPFPVPPAVLSSTAQAGGFTVSLGMVSNAERYELRYRSTGSTGAWVHLTSDGTLFTVTGLPSGASYDVQRFVKTAAGLSLWSDVTPVITL